MKDEALKKAEHALEGVLQVPEKISMMHILDVVRFIRQAREEKQQEPVAWMFQHEETGRTLCVDTQQVEWGFEKGNPRLKKIAPLYTSPPARKPLTDADLGMYISKELAEYINGAYADTGCAKDQLIHFARAIEAAHGIKENT